MNQNLSNIDFDPELLLGAYNALNVCLRLQPEERLTLITDQDTLEIAAALIHEIEKIGSDYRVFILEDFMPRPLSHMPLQILDDLKQSQVSIFAALSRTGELKIRIALTALVNRYKIRHGHMVDINKQIMREGMRDGSVREISTFVAQNLIAGAVNAAMDIDLWRKVDDIDAAAIDYFDIFFNGLLPRNEAVTGKSPLKKISK